MALSGKLKKNKKHTKTKEDTLRNRIISVLKAQKQPSERIRDNCGSNEHGLDIVLLKLDPFGQLRAHGIQIKTGDINCKSKPNKGVKEIIGQLAIAFGQNVDFDGKKYKLNSFYVMTNGDIGSMARSYIASACENIRNLHFIDGQSLDEFLVGEAQVTQFEET